MVSFQPNGGGQFLGQCVCVASAMQSSKGFCVSELWKTRLLRCVFGAQFKIVQFEFRLVRRCLEEVAHVLRNHHPDKQLWHLCKKLRKKSSAIDTFGRHFPIYP
jgi:hypothetical protein